MSDFRDVLYDKYFENQSGRRLNKDIAEKLRENWYQLSHEVLPLLPTDKSIRILDLGCGFGELLMLLKEKGYTHAEGIDISPDQIAHAHELGLSNAQVADAFKFLEASPAEYDIILGIDIIEHFSKDELVRLLGLVKTALKANGTAIFRTPNMDAPYTSIYAYGDFTHQALLNYSSAQQLGRSVGFSKVEVLPSFMYVNGGLKELIRKISWALFLFNAKLSIFATGRSTQGVYFTPNLLLKVTK
jgi:2-polyprenyl-3-methyl-5-hydroxy-6-metoxy-1,4-benzoquinol methylase